jgi:hypothetical protein
MCNLEHILQLVEGSPYLAAHTIYIEEVNVLNVLGKKPEHGAM